MVAFPVPGLPLDPGKVRLAGPHMVAAYQADPEIMQDLLQAVLKRFCRGDWGDLSAEDRLLNDRELGTRAGRLLAKYQLQPEFPVYVIHYLRESTDGESGETSIMHQADY